MHRFLFRFLLDPGAQAPRCPMHTASRSQAGVLDLQSARGGASLANLRARENARLSSSIARHPPATPCLRHGAAVHTGRSYMRSPGSYSRGSDVPSTREEAPSPIAATVSRGSPRPPRPEAHVISASLFGGGAIVFAPVPLPGCELEALLPQRERHLRYSTSEGAIVSRSRLPQYSRVEASNDCSLMPTSWYPLPAAHQRTGFAKPQSPAYGRVLIAPGTRWSTAMSPPRPLEPEGRRQVCRCPMPPRRP